MSREIVSNNHGATPTVDSLNGILTFVTTARCSSFTQAADHLGISKSAVGKAIARLEERLGVQLFHRTTRRVVLSADGEAYLAACSLALEEISGAEQGLGSSAHEPTGKLRLDMPAAFGRQILMPILADMGRRFPKLQLTVTYNDILIDPLEDGVDLLIRFGALGDFAGLVARRLTTHRWVICASPSYLKDRGIPMSIMDVQDHACIVTYRRGQPFGWKVRQGEESRIMPPATHQFSDGESMVQAAIAGMGLCQMPLFAVRRHLDRGELVTVLDAFEPAPVDVHALWPKVGHLRPKIRFLVDALVELGEQGKLD